MLLLLYLKQAAGITDVDLMAGWQCSTWLVALARPCVMHCTTVTCVGLWVWDGDSGLLACHVHAGPTAGKQAVVHIEIQPVQAYAGIGLWFTCCSAAW